MKHFFYIIRIYTLWFNVLNKEDEWIIGYVTNKRGINYSRAYCNVLTIKLFIITSYVTFFFSFFRATILLCILKYTITLPNIAIMCTYKQFKIYLTGITNREKYTTLVQDILSIQLFITWVLLLNTLSTIVLQSDRISISRVKLLAALWN